MIKLPTLSPRSVQLAFLLVASEISPKVVLSLFPLKISWFKSKPDQNLESHVGCCSCTLKKWLLKEFASTMQAATNADVQHPTSALLQPYLSSHISWSLCVLASCWPTLMSLVHAYCRVAVLPSWTPLGSGMAFSATPALQNCRQTRSRAAPRQGSCSSIIPTLSLCYQHSCPT